MFQLEQQSTEIGPPGFVNKTTSVYIIRKLGIPNMLHLFSQTNFSDASSALL